MKNKETYSEFYDNLYKGEVDIDKLRIQKFISPSKRVKRQIIAKELSHLPKDSSVLEIGCGLGDLIGFMKFDNLEGIDISNAAIQKARLLFPRATFEVIDASKPLDLEPKYDSIILADVIEHIEDDNPLLEGAYKFLKKEGLLIIFTPCSGKEEDVSLISIDDLRKQSFGIGGDLRHYGFNLVKRLGDIGFEIKKVRYIGGPLSSWVWKLKEKILKGSKAEDKYNDQIKEEIMTGNFMNASFLSRVSKRLFSKMLFWLYLWDYKLFSKKQKKGIFLIVAKK